MPFYESTFIARQDINSGQVENLAETFSNVISENDGNLVRQEYWGLRTLAYRIKKNRKGHYVSFNIDASAAAIAQLERSMRINEDVLRYLTVRVDELDPNPSVIMQARTAREGSRRGGGRGRGEVRESAHTAAPKGGGVSETKAPPAGEAADKSNADKEAKSE